jgi:hypothetical protein
MRINLDEVEFYTKYKYVIVCDNIINNVVFDFLECGSEAAAFDTKAVASLKHSKARSLSEYWGTRLLLILGQAPRVEKEKGA